MNERQVSVSRVIAAPAEKIFAVLADPSQHAAFDGSGTVRTSRHGSEPLKLGSRFGMNMKLGIPYRINNTVVEFEEPRRIAWAHFGKHIWRYQLDPDDSGGTRVTETFDWSKARSARLIELAGYPKRHPAAMTRTLERLAVIVESP